jgi:hypothetical protein
MSCKKYDADAVFLFSKSDREGVLPKAL